LYPNYTPFTYTTLFRSLETYKDFINGVRDVAPASREAAEPISGIVKWDGKITGPSSGSTFQGHVRGEKARYDGVFVDFLEGDLRSEEHTSELQSRVDIV